MRTTLEKLLQTYKGLSDPSTPPVLRTIYGRRLSKVHKLCNCLVIHGICRHEQAHNLLYQLVIQKSRWRRTKRRIYATEKLAHESPDRAREYYQALYVYLSEVATTPLPQEMST